MAHVQQDTFAHQALSLQSHVQLVPTVPWLLRATANPAPRVSSAQPTPLLWQGMSVLLAITAQPPPPSLLSSPVPGACTSHREEESTGQTVAPVNQGPTVSCLGWSPHRGSVVLGSTATMEHLSRIPQMGLQGTFVLQATSVLREAPILFHVALASS